MDSRTLAVIFALTLLILTRQSSGPVESPPKLATAIFEYSTSPQQTPSPALSPSPETAVATPLPQDLTPSLPQIEAKSAALFDASTGQVIFAKNPDTPQAIASITKLVTGVIALENASLGSGIIVGESDLALEGHHTNLAAGDVFSLNEALYFLLISSDNALAQALSRTIADDFVSKMNAKAQSLGMVQSSFSNPTGLDGNYSTAKDLFSLAKYIADNHRLLFDISRQATIALISRQGKAFELKNTNVLIGKLPGILGGKTGYTPEADGSLLLYLERGKTNLIGVVLGSSDRFGDMTKIFNWYWQNYSPN